MKKLILSLMLIFGCMYGVFAAEEQEVAQAPKLNIDYDQVGRDIRNWNAQGLKDVLSKIIEDGDMHVQSILSRFDIGFDSVNILHVGAYTKDPDLVRMALQIGISVNSKSLAGMVYSTALRYNGFTAPRKIGVLPDGQEFCKNFSYQDHATQRLEIATMLLAAKADPNIVSNGFDSTVLMQAITYKDIALAEILLQGGADPNLKLRESGFALHFAAAKDNNLDMVKLLVKYGADIYKKNWAGRTPLVCAGDRNFAFLNTAMNNSNLQEDQVVQALARKSIKPLILLKSIDQYGSPKIIPIDEDVKE